VRELAPVLDPAAAHQAGGAVREQV
jgi:hypothetical protein